MEPLLGSFRVLQHCDLPTKGSGPSLGVRSDGTVAPLLLESNEQEHFVSSSSVPIVILETEAQPFNRLRLGG